MKPSTDQTVSRSQGKHAGRNAFVLSGVFFITVAGYNVWRVTFHNYSVEVFDVDAATTGLIFSMMAVPGLLAAGIAVLARWVPIVRLLVTACCLVGGGLIWLSLAPTWTWLLWGVAVVGLGFALFYPVINGLCLLDSDPGEVSVRLGRLKSYGPIAATLAAATSVAAMEATGYRGFLLVAGGVVLVCGVAGAVLLVDQAFKSLRTRVRPRLMLWPYYVLNFVAGCRSALFKTFVLFMLVTEYGFELRGTASIVVAGSLCSFLGYRLIGHAGKRWGRRNTLSWIYLSVCLVFVGFATFETTWILVSLYLLDSVLFTTSALTESVLKERAAAEYFVGDVAAGLTLFYAGSVLAPLVGGLLWERVDERAGFMLGSLVALAAAAVSRRL